MTTVKASCEMEAPISIVFEAVSNIEKLPETSPDIVKIEFLSEKRQGLGTQFRETRMMRGKEMLTDLEVTEYEEDKFIRIVTDSHGTIWDTSYSFEPLAAGTQLNMVMDARPHKLIPRIINPLMKGMFRRGIEKYLVDLKAYCEGEHHAERA